MSNSNPTLIADMLRQSLVNGQTPFLTISSNSMAPLLKIGDQVGLEPANVSQLKIGDIITLVQDSHLLTHRFWGLDRDGLLQTRGDRPLSFDSAMPSTQLLGRVIVRRRASQVLALNSGPGQWLNRHLTQLYKTEARLLNLPLPIIKQKRLLVRLIHRKVYLWAYLIVGRINSRTK